MTYLLKNTETGKYVAKPGSARSYTTKVENAQTFETREQAVKDSCVENETPVPAPRM
jgi:hypothetical protein